MVGRLSGLPISFCNHADAELPKCIILDVSSRTSMLYLICSYCEVYRSLILPADVIFVGWLSGLQPYRRHRPRDVMTPRRVTSLESCVGAGDRIVHISTSNAGHWDAHMLALTEQGAVLACGAGSKGQLGCQLPEGGFERNTPCVVDGLQV